MMKVVSFLIKILKYKVLSFLVSNFDILADSLQLQGAVETAMKSSILAEEGEDEDEKAMVGKLALVNEAKKYLAEEKGREATVQELAAYTQLTEEELSDILLLIQKADQKDK